MNPQPHTWLGKYRELLAAIALFLVLDLGVLIFNTYTSHLIERDTAHINTAGELRVYSQQLTKALLTLRMEMQSGDSYQTSQAQLSESYSAFSTALQHLQGLTLGSSGPGASMDPQSRELLDQLVETWEPINTGVLPVLNAATPSAWDVDDAVNRAVTRNVRLMQLADDLTRHLEAQAVSRAASLRYIQLVAIFLASLNFFFIVFKFIRRLLESDRQIEAARQETREILDTVREGLFLLDRDGHLGIQQSRSLPELFGRPVAPGLKFDELIAQLLEPEQQEAARDYIDLLFNRKVKPALLEELNPLREVTLAAGQDGRRKGPTHLSFEFTQVLEQGEVRALLVTVFDISRQMQLARDLAGAEARASSEVESLLAVLDQDPAQVRDFLKSGEDRLGMVNQALQDVQPEARAYAELINFAFRAIHSIKGEAGALGLLEVSRQAHQFEDLLTPLRRRQDLTGDDLIPIAFQVGELRQKLAQIGEVLAKVRRYQEAPVSQHPFVELKKQIEHLALKVAEDLNKKVRVEVNFPQQAPNLDERLLRHLHEMLPQLVRNAVAHGIESEAERLQAGKLPEGTVRVEFATTTEGSLSVSVRDDGRGISCARIRARLLELGHPHELVESMSERELIATLFTPGFSLQEEANEHAGRGVGLDLIRDMASRAGARIRLSTLPNAYTQFTLQFQPAS